MNKQKAKSTISSQGADSRKRRRSGSGVAPGSMAEVRKYVIDEYVAPAKKRGERSLTIGAQSVREGLDGTKPISLVCRAIDSTQFAQASGTTLLDRQGPPASDQVVWRFRL